MMNRSMPTTPADPQSLFFNTDVPNSARIFDYLVGGTANFEVDRAAAAKLIHIWPFLLKVICLCWVFVYVFNFSF